MGCVVLSGAWYKKGSALAFAEGFVAVAAADVDAAAADMAVAFGVEAEAEVDAAGLAIRRFNLRHLHNKRCLPAPPCSYVCLRIP